MAVQTPKMKLRGLRYLKIQQQKKNIAKNGVTIYWKPSQKTGW